LIQCAIAKNCVNLISYASQVNRCSLYRCINNKSTTFIHKTQAEEIHS